MLTIITYAFGIMYTPGPVNLLSVHSGIHGKFSSNVGFFIGVSCAMFTLYQLIRLLLYHLCSMEVNKGESACKSFVRGTYYVISLGWFFYAIAKP